MSIQRYLELLVEEIDEKMEIPSPARIGNSDCEDFFFEPDELDELMECQGIPLTNYSKILKESLPPPEKLNPEQAGILVDKITALLDNWNFHLEYPVSTPVKEKYRLIYENWEEFEIPKGGWHFHQDFCSGSCEECEVKEYCDTYNKDEKYPENVVTDKEIDELDKIFIPDQETESKPGKEFSSKKEKIKWILDSIQEKDFIPSVHNYCDRWCDKCSLRSKCSAFYFEKELLKVAAEDNTERSPFESVKHVYNITHIILEENLNENGLDFDLPFKTNDSFFPKIPFSEQKVLDFAKEYAFSTSQWFNSFPEEKIVANPVFLEPVNVIMYYHIFISAKLARAFFGRVSYPDDDPYQNDSNGSAKIALMAIKASLNSWSNLVNHDIKDKQVILQQCVKLKKLQKMVERFFPHTQKFLRPGFDFLPE